MSKGHPSGSSTWRLTNRRVAPLEGEYSYDSPDTDPHIRSYEHLHMRSYPDTKIRLITRIAYGFKNVDALIAMAMLSLGGHRPALPGRN